MKIRTNPIFLFFLAALLSACGDDGENADPIEQTASLFGAEGPKAADTSTETVASNPQESPVVAQPVGQGELVAVEQPVGQDEPVVTVDLLLLEEQPIPANTVSPEEQASTAEAVPLFDDLLLMPSEGLIKDGASFLFFNQGASLKWNNAGGDYIDSNLIGQGSVPWAVAAVKDTDTVYDVLFDVTKLAKAWVISAIPNRGMLIKQVSGSSGPIDYATKEHSEAQYHPTLTVTTVESGTTTFSPLGDTMLNSSTTVASFGQATTMRVTPLHNGATVNGLIWFDLSALEGQTVTSAELKLTTLKQFSNTVTNHGVFAVETESWDKSKPVRGIANLFAKDVGISDHPDVYFNYGFNSRTTADGGDVLSKKLAFGFKENFWPCSETSPAGGRNPDGTEYPPIVGIPGYKPFDRQGDSLCMRLKYEDGPPNEAGIGNYGVNFTYLTKKFAPVPQVQDLYVRYYIYLGDTWGENVLNESGKLPGGIEGRQVNTPYQAGWGGRRTDGSNGWSARMGYKPVVPSGNNPLGGFTRLTTYLYHADQLGQYGDNIAWDKTPNALIKRGRWYCIENYLKMNTRDGLNVHGESGAHDGVIRTWVDGRLTFEKTDIRFTDMDYIAIDAANFGLYYGGIGNTPWDQHIAIDNVVAAKSYIGPMKMK